MVAPVTHTSWREMNGGGGECEKGRGSAGPTVTETDKIQPAASRRTARRAKFPSSGDGPGGRPIMRMIQGLAIWPERRGGQNVALHRLMKRPAGGLQVPEAGRRTAREAFRLPMKRHGSVLHGPEVDPRTESGEPGRVEGGVPVRATAPHLAGKVPHKVIPGVSRAYREKGSSAPFPCVCSPQIGEYRGLSIAGSRGYAASVAFRSNG